MPCSAKIVVLGSHPRDTGALQLYELSKGQLNLVLEVRCALIEKTSVANKISLLLILSVRKKALL